jgi:hypothetical protein
MESRTFNRARQKAGLTVDDVVRVTRLSPRIVSAIDEGHYDRLPSGLYARTAVRQFAAAVGLDSGAALAEVLAELPAAPLDLIAMADLREHEQPRSLGARYLLAAAVDVSVVLLIAAAITVVCSAVCQMMPAALVKSAPAPIFVVCTTPVILYFWILGATDVRTVGPWLFDLEILPRSDGPLSLRAWVRRGLSYVLCEVRFALMAD